MRRVLTVFGVLMLLVGGCGDDDAGGSDAPTTSGPVAAPATTTDGVTSTTTIATSGAAAATSCEELADNFIASTQGMLDAYGDASFAALQLESVPPEWKAAGALWFDDFATLGELAESLGCGEGLDQLICERQPQLDPQGDAGLKFISESTPCGVEGAIEPAATAAYEARSETWYESQE
jgi:hypothetical protein